VGKANKGFFRRRVHELFGRITTFKFFEEDEIIKWLNEADLELLDLSHKELALLFAAKKR
jgi:hypothetical protein